MQNLSSNIHHIEEHEASMLVLVLLRQMNETVLFVERNGGEIGIDSDVTECGSSLSHIQHFQQSSHKVSPNLPASEIHGYRKTTYLNCRVTAKSFIIRKTVFDFLPPAIRYLLTTNLII